ncbi:MAG: family 43 glycosylhydrolase [Fibromonadaceae bacterium]|jgi:arabinoxylan arabinofuranohydrolase|nr:family 43 glycosylhydrolase [Fibromonadaceae bacterium]
MKDKTYVHFLVLLAVVVSTFTTFANPILSHKYTADPQPIVWNDRLYVYASNDDQSTNPDDGYMIQAYTLVSTDDMANWTDHGEVFRVPRDWRRGTATSARAYAPGAAVRGNTVYLYPCGAGGPVGVVTAPRPEGPFNDVLNGVPLVDRNTCTNCNVPWLFDPAVFIDDDGQAYLYYGGGDASGTPGPGENLRVIRLNDDMISLRREANNTINAVTIQAPRSFEAAYMHKRGDIYYFSYVNNFSGGDQHPNAAIMYMTGSSPMGPFTLRGPVLRNPAIGNQNINRNNNNHQAIIEYQGKWYMFYHDRRVANANNVPSNNANQRNISVDSLVYNADGTMREVVVTHDGVAQIKHFNPYTTISAATMNRQSGIKTDSISGEGMIVTSISDGNWIRLKGVDFGTAGASRFIVRAASGSSGGSIELRTGSATGTSIGICNIASTGGWNTWRNFECDVNASGSAGVKDFLFLVFRGTEEPFRLSWYQFQMANQSSSSAATPSSSSAAPSSSSVANAGTSSSSAEGASSSSSSGGTTSILSQYNQQDAVIVKYYNLQGQPLGTQKPITSGVYIVRNSKTGQTQMMVVK